MQRTRRRLHYEQGHRTLRGARCARCHGPLLGADRATYYLERRRLRVCSGCAKEED